MLTALPFPLAVDSPPHPSSHQHHSPPSRDHSSYVGGCCGCHFVDGGDGGGGGNGGGHPVTGKSRASKTPVQQHISSASTRSQRSVHQCGGEKREKIKRSQTAENRRTRYVWKKKRGGITSEVRKKGRKEDSNQRGERSKQREREEVRIKKAFNRQAEHKPIAIVLQTTFPASMSPVVCVCACIACVLVGKKK